MIYFLQHKETGLIKIGVTKDLDARLLTLRVAYGELELLGLIAGFEGEENELHTQFRDLNVRRALRGREWFKPEKKLIEYINKYASMDKPLPIGTRKRYSPMPAKAVKTTQIRVSDDTQKLIFMLAAELQMKTGKKISCDLALRSIIERAFPEIAKEMGIDIQAELEALDQ